METSEFVRYKNALNSLQDQLGLCKLDFWDTTENHSYVLTILEYLNETLTLKDLSDNYSAIKEFCSIVDEGNELLFSGKTGDLYEKMGILDSVLEVKNSEIKEVLDKWRPIITEETESDTEGEEKENTDETESEESAGSSEEKEDSSSSEEDPDESEEESSSDENGSDSTKDESGLEDTESEVEGLSEEESTDTEESETTEEAEEEKNADSTEDGKYLTEITENSTWSDIYFGITWANICTSIWATIKCNYAEVLWEMEHQECSCRCNCTYAIDSEDNLYAKLVNTSYGTGNGSNFTGSTGCGCSS